VLLIASMTVCAFLSGMAMTSNHPVTGSIIVSARNVCVDLESVQCMVQSSQRLHKTTEVLLLLLVVNVHAFSVVS
jgi:uncharacterized oligopeptide transporter (OPT) family protein